MAKRTKFSKFRDLYEVIEELAVSYTYEGVVEILAERHDLILTTGTLTNYLYRYRKESKELSVATDNSSNNIKVKPEVKKQIFVDSKGNESIQESDVGTSAKPHVDPTMDDLDATAAAFREVHGIRLRIATKYHRLVREFLRDAGVADYALVDSQGATEGTVANETAEATADITSTGDTLRANHLKILSDGLILASQATLWRSRSADLSTAERKALKTLLSRINA